MATLAMMAGITISASAVSAQEKSEQAAASPTVCLARPVRGGNDDGKLLSISVPAERADEFLKRGFEVVDCSTSRVTEASVKQDFCHIAQMRNRGVDLYFQQYFGFTPREGCETFDAVSVR